MTSVVLIQRAAKSAGRGCGHRLADLLGQHEADVLLDHLELLDVLCAALAERLHEALNQLLGSARAGGDAERLHTDEPVDKP